MKVILRLPRTLYESALVDLERPHAFAAERVGFFSTSILSGGKGVLLVCIRSYQALPDDHYVDDPRSGARINSRAIRESLQRVLDQKSGQLHVHLHEHAGRPRPSFMDADELPALIQSMIAIDPNQAHGGLILSRDSGYATLWLPRASGPQSVSRISVVGCPMHFFQ